jgi:hypothetical protein
VAGDLERISFLRIGTGIWRSKHHKRRKRELTDAEVNALWNAFVGGVKRGFVEGVTKN